VEGPAGRVVANERPPRSLHHAHFGRLLRMNLFRRLARSWPLAYDPMRYWNARQNPNADVGEEKTRLEFDTNYIRRNISTGERILELGPGVGRTLRAYVPNTEVTTLDISRIYQEELSAFASSLELRLEQHYVSSMFEPFPFSDQEFDVGVSFQVFIHQPPAIFAHSFSEMLRVCRRLIVSVGLHLNTRGSKKARARHVFNHDYISEGARNRKLLSNVLVRDGVLYFVVHGDNSSLWIEERGHD
jgi:SAM-dependent methyltransferase